MDRSRRGGTKLARPSSESNVPAASRLSVRARKNRRRPGSLWSRLPKPRAMADACGRAVRRSVPALVATAAIGVIGSSVWLGYRFVTHLGPVRDHLDRGPRQPRTSRADEVRAALPVHVGDNVFATNLGDRRERAAPDPVDRDRLGAPRPPPHARRRDPRARRRPRSSSSASSTSSTPAATRSSAPTSPATTVPACRSSPASTASPTRRPRRAPRRSITSALDALATWRADPTRPAIGEVHLDPHHALTLHTYDSAVAIQLGALGRELAARMQTFDAAWAELTDAERATRARHPPRRPHRSRHRRLREGLRQPPWPSPRPARSSSDSTSAPPRSPASSAR